MVIKTKNIEIAEDKKEAFWLNQVKNLKVSIENLENELMFQKELLELAKSKVKPNKIKE